MKEYEFFIFFRKNKEEKQPRSMKPLSMSMILLKFHLTIHMKATEHYFPVILFIMLHKVILTFDFVDEILWCDHSNESY